jgi:tripartite ATP-independent transporter DctM subunit
MVIGLMFLVLFGLITIGAPILIALGVSGFVHYLDTGRETVLIILAQQIYARASSYPFLAIPLFLLAGNIMTKGGITDKLITLARVLIGHFTGGLAQINILASVFFASISGSAFADVAAIGSLLIPAMKKEKYPLGFAGALTASSATLSPLIPPSIVLIVYGSVFEVSIGALFAAGLGIGVMYAVALMVITYFISKKYDVPQYKKASSKEVWDSFRASIIPLIMPIIVLGGILSGLFTATEAASVAVAYGLLITIFFYRSIKFKDLYGILLNTAYTASAIVLLVAASSSFAYVIVRRNVAHIVMTALLDLTESPFVIMMLIVVVLLIAGMFIGRNANILLFGPIIVPIMYELGYSPIQTAMIIVMTLGVGHITPPVGGTLLTTMLIGDISMPDIMRYMWPYILVTIFTCILIILIPSLSEGVPRLFGLI